MFDITKDIQANDDLPARRGRVHQASEENETARHPDS
jgi:hypothetical protein